MAERTFGTEVLQQLLALVERFLIELSALNEFTKATFHFCFCKQG